jgi:anti-anti-sigma regulatory factor
VIAAPLPSRGARLRRLGERTAVVDVGPGITSPGWDRLEAATVAVAETGCHEIVLDLTRLRRWEPPLLGELARVCTRLRGAGCALFLAARDPELRDELREGGLDRCATVAPSVVAALHTLLHPPAQRLV